MSAEKWAVLDADDNVLGEGPLPVIHVTRSGEPMWAVCGDRRVFLGSNETVAIGSDVTLTLG